VSIIVVYSLEVQAQNMWKIGKKEIEVNYNCQKNSLKVQNVREHGTVKIQENS
jgi:hypothetical protein